MVSFAPDISSVTVQLTSCGKESGAAVIDRLRVLLAEGAHFIFRGAMRDLGAFAGAHRPRGLTSRPRT